MFRLGQREATTAVTLVSGLAIWGTVNGFGPFIRESLNESLLLLQAFVCVIAATIMSLAGALTERVRAEKALRGSEERYRTLAEAAHDSIFIVDRYGYIEYVNSFAARQLGCQPEEIIGKPRDSLFPSEVSSRQKSNLQKVFRNGEPLYVEEVTPFTDRQVWLGTRLVPIKDEAGEVNAVLGISRDINESKRAEGQIKASLEEKEVLLKEIHHRVKNNLQIISSLLDLQSGYIKEEATLKMFEESQRRVKSMALVHEELYGSEDLARIDFAHYIQNLTNHLFRSYGVNPDDIVTKINVDDVLLDIDKAIPCGLIINELVSNSLKHAFPDGGKGEIRIDLSVVNDSQFGLMVSDNGVGYPKDTDLRNTPSLGLRLVNILVKQLEGSINIDNVGGSTFEILFSGQKQEERSQEDGKSTDPGC